MSAAGFVIQETRTGCYVALRAGLPQGCYVRSVERATVFHSRSQASHYCESSRDVVKPAAQAFALPGTTDYVCVPPKPEV